jgi:hypothetical protein
VQQHDQPGEGEGGATAFADHVHPVDLAPGFDRADGEQQLQTGVGGQGEAEEGEGVEFEQGFSSGLRGEGSRQCVRARKQMDVTVG